MEVSPPAIQLTFEGDEAFEAGTAIRGHVKLQWTLAHPYLDILPTKSTASNHSSSSSPSRGNLVVVQDEKKEDDLFRHSAQHPAQQPQPPQQHPGTVIVALEAYEQTTLVRRRYRYGVYHNSSRVFQHESRIVHLETSYPVPCCDPNGGPALLDFSLDLPENLPSSLVHKYVNAVEQGSCCIIYRLTIRWKREEVGCLAAHAAAARDRCAILLQSKVVEIQKKRHTPIKALSLSASSIVDIPVFYCGFFQVATDRTFVLNVEPQLQHLNLSPNQTLQLVFHNANDRHVLGLDENNGGTGILMAKLTQKLVLSAKKEMMLDELMLEGDPNKSISWEMPVDPTTNTAKLPCSTAKVDLNMSYTGTLFEFHHELIVYVIESTTKSIVATSQPIPVILSPGNTSVSAITTIT